MKIIAVIPARYAATRFPAKLMQTLGTKTVILHTYENTVATGLFTDVFVVTDHEIIFKEIIEHGGKAIMSKKNHESGTDRIVEAVEKMDVDVIINVQGDEPFVKKEPLKKLCELFYDEKVEVGSLMHAITNKELISDSNAVKVVVNKNMDALYFSRSAIPFLRDETFQPIYYKHIGLYGYRKETILKFTSLKPSMLEKAEKLEQLRLLENGIPIRMAITEPWGISIDSPEDLEKARGLFNSFF
jgi:3-deoxy-manno-octulosonate cytidylyltransferase (CMP-KDO synthetase)